MPAVLHGLAAWGRIMTREIEEIERMHSKALKQLLQVPISTSTAGVLKASGRQGYCLLRSVCNIVQ